MTVERLTRFTLFGMVRDRESALHALQALGLVHIEPLVAPPEDKAHQAQIQRTDALRAFRFLASVPNRRRQDKNLDRFDADHVIGTALDLKDRLDDLADQRDALNARIGILAPWGSFTLPEPGTFGPYRLWFYRLHPYQIRKLPKDDRLVWQVVHKDHQYAYLVVISPEPPDMTLIPSTPVDIGDRSLNDLYAELETVELALEELEAKRTGLTRWLYQLARVLAHSEDAAARKVAQAMTFDDGTLFALHGWLPRNQQQTLIEFARAQGLTLTLDAPSELDTPPTLLANPERFSGGEEVIGFYSLPSYHSFDPSILLFFSFSLFFAIILSDAGYALLLSVVMGLVWGSLGQHRQGRRLRALAGAAVGASIVWGVLVGSYFGMTPAPGTWLARLHIVDITDQALMMPLSVAIGIGHLILASLGQAWNRRRASPGSGWLASVGWSVILLGGGALVGTRALGLDEGGSGLTAGLALIGFGAALVVAFSSSRRGATWSDRALRVLEGLVALTNISKLFGDVLSYLRLFALGLASASLAVTFNDLARQAMEALPGSGVLVAVLILAIGHGINFLLCLMSGLVHGLRLNLIEFFNWGIAEEGHPFRAFRKKELKGWTSSSSR